jgi:hypothetical protein
MAEARICWIVAVSGVLAAAGGEVKWTEGRFPMSVMRPDPGRLRTSFRRTSTAVTRTRFSSRKSTRRQSATRVATGSVAK